MTVLRLCGMNHIAEGCGSLPTGSGGLGARAAQLTHGHVGHHEPAEVRREAPLARPALGIPVLEKYGQCQGSGMPNLKEHPEEFEDWLRSVTLQGREI